MRRLIRPHPRLAASGRAGAPRGRRPDSLAAAVVASWARYAEGADEQGEPIEVVDRRREAVIAAAARQRAQPDAFLRQHDLFGDLADDAVFTADYLAALRSLHSEGARATLRALR